MRHVTALLTVATVVIFCGSAIGGPTYFGADWKGAHNEKIDGQTGMWGIEGASIGEDNYVAGGFLLGQFSYHNENFVRGDINGKLGHWFSKPFIGADIGYKIRVYDAPGSDDTTFIHGPMIGVKGFFPLSYFDKEVIKGWDFAPYYVFGYSPATMKSKSEDEPNVSNATAKTIEIGMEITHLKKGLTMKLGYRNEKVSKLGNSDEELSGLLIQLVFQ
ncbi:MAG: hypothetical protein C0404_01550 [Verrucomicrobia bacterium]|nr:hypothetical protein [Verrucomicrobiota bacterium]